MTTLLDSSVDEVISIHSNSSHSSGGKRGEKDLVGIVGCLPEWVTQVVWVEKILLVWLGLMCFVLKGMVC